MAKKPVVKQQKIKQGDKESKGKKKGGSKVTSIGKSQKTRKNSKDAVRERKGR